jgi:hypothetical protein
MADFSASREASTLARLQELHRAEQAPPDFRVRVAERLARLEAPAPRRALSRRGRIGLLLLAAAAAVLMVRSERTRVTLVPEQPTALRTAEVVGAPGSHPGGAPAAEAAPRAGRGVAGSGTSLAAPSHSVDMKAGRIEVAGGLAPSLIRAVMRDQLGRFRDCYESLPPPRPVVSSKLNFTIGAAGNVTAGHVDSEASPALGKCLEGVMFEMRFPAPRAGDVTVGYPVQFAP